jgi:uncharacterized membrane protein YdjX (TVP38/TMEM64 family)
MTAATKRQAARTKRKSPPAKQRRISAKKRRAPPKEESAAEEVVSNPIWVPIAGTAGFIALGFAWLLLPLDEWMKQFSEWINGFGAAGVIGFALLYLLGTLVLMPGTPLSIAAGIAYGWWALLLVLGAGLVSAVLAFLISRYLLRDRVDKFLQQRPPLRAAEEAVNEEGWKVVALLRLSPVIPFAVQNYFFGVTGVPLATFLTVSAIAILPGSFLNIYLGVLGRTAAQDGAAVSWGFLIVGLIATIAVMVLVTIKARAKLREHGVKA